MEKRTIALFSMLMICMVLLMCSIYAISTQDGLMTAAAQQSSYRLEVAKMRGTIYDYRKTPLTGTGKVQVAAVSPTIEAANALTAQLPAEDKESIFTMLSKGTPFALRLESNSTLASNPVNGIDVFTVSDRYTDEPLLPHVIGYLDGAGNGVSGVEQSFNDWLSDTGAEISVRYKVDAVNRALNGAEKEISNTSYLQTKGVVLTIDERIQKIAQEAAKKYMQKGAVVVAEVPTCDLRAVVSLPDFSPNDLENSLNDEDSPLLNRAFSSYNVGSVFKLVTASAALESGLSSDLSYDCTGSIDVDGMAFRCFNGQGHGTITMKDAIAYSCNGYFIQLAQQMPVATLLNMAKRFGFGTQNQFAANLISASGTLPTTKDL